MLETLMTVNLIMALVQTFYLGMKWEQHRAAAASPPAPLTPTPKEPE